MKNSILIFAMALLCFGCKKDDPDVSVGVGEARFMLNDMLREPKIERAVTNTTIEGLFDLDFSIYVKYGTETWAVEDLNIYKVPKKEGRYALVRTQSQTDDGKVGANFYTLSDQGDVLEEVYLLDETAPDNYIDVLHYSKKSNEVAGKYNGTFIIDPDRGKMNPNSPDMVRITQGEFYLKFE